MLAEFVADTMNEYFRLVRFDAAGAFVGEDSQTHDDNGNRIQNGEHRLFFDLFDRLVRVERVSDGATVGTYRHDAAGRRVHKEFLNPASGAQEEVFFVSDGVREIEELDGAGNVVADYVFGSLYVDQVVQMRRGGQDYYLHSNSLFSVSAVTDAAGSVVERYEYRSVYGTVAATDAGGGALSAAAEVGNPWRFTGRRLDSETGLYHYRLRYYDPGQGRFVSRDPLGLWGDLGQRGVEQGYCGGNPVNRADPFGLKPGPQRMTTGEPGGPEWDPTGPAPKPQDNTPLVVQVDLHAAVATAAANLVPLKAVGGFSYAIPLTDEDLDSLLVDAAHAILQSIADQVADHPGRPVLLDLMGHGSGGKLGNPAYHGAYGAILDPGRDYHINTWIPAFAALGNLHLLHSHMGVATPHIYAVVLHGCATERHASVIQQAFTIPSVEYVFTTTDYCGLGSPGILLSGDVDTELVEYTRLKGNVETARATEGYDKTPPQEVRDVKRRVVAGDNFEPFDVPTRRPPR